MRRPLLCMLFLVVLVLAWIPGGVAWADTASSDATALASGPLPAGGGQGGPGPGGGGGSAPPPSSPYASASCRGPNNDGTVYPGQQDACTLTAVTTFRAGNRLVVSPAGAFTPVDEAVDSCSGASGVTTATKNFERQTRDPISCSFTVVSGVTVLPGQMLGTAVFRIDVMTAPDTTIRLTVVGCSDGPGSACGGLNILASGPGGTVSSDPPFTVSLIPLTATEGQPYIGPVATISDAEPTASPSEYVADITWGDGTSQTQASMDGWSVIDSHTYLEEGTYFVTVTVTDRDLDHSTMTSGWVTVADAALHPRGAIINTTNPLNATLATFSDDDPNGVVTDYTATIGWGDGSSSPASITQDLTGFDVSGSHVYGNLGPYAVTVHVCDAGGACSDTNSSVLVFAYTSGGNFVVGDGGVTLGSSVTYWSSRWASANTVSSGAPPDDFKGFADHPNGAPACGTNWSTTPGNSAHPPDTVPTYTAVIVSTSVSQDAAHTTGDSAQIVIVKTDSGYAPDPGHPGTGTIVAVLCP